MPAIRILSLNIEGDNHLDRVQKLLFEKQPDVFCVQEIFKTDIPIFQKLLKVKGVFYPVSRIEEPTTVRLNPKGEWGIALFSRLPTQSIHLHTYVGNLNHIPLYNNDDPNDCNRLVIVAELSINGKTLYVATTHFTWSDKGMDTPLQHENLDVLLRQLKPYRPLILCGDFNAPRGKTVFARLATEYKDNIPANFTTSLDPVLHRVKKLELMVDGFFSSPDLPVENVVIIPDVSDHQAVYGEVTI